MSLIDEKAWTQYQSKVETQQKMRITTIIFFILSSALYFAFLITSDDYTIFGALFAVIILFLSIFFIILGIDYLIHRLSKSETPWRYLYTQKQRLGYLAIGGLIFTIVLSSILLDDLMVGFILFIIIILILFLGVLGFSFGKHYFTQSQMPWRTFIIPKMEAGLKEKEKVLQTIRTSMQTTSIDIESLMRISKIKNRDLIVELVRDSILLGSIDYEQNKIIALTNETAKESDILMLRQRIEEQSQRIELLEKSVTTLGGSLPSTEAQASFTCSICHQEIKEGEPIWTDSDFHVFHSTHIKEWIRVYATHPVTKSKMPPMLDYYDPNAVLIDGKLMDLEQARIQKLL